MFPGQAHKGRSFRQVLPYQTVHVLVRSAFPRVVGPCETVPDFQFPRHPCVPGKLLSVVGRNRVQEFPVRPERRNHGIGQIAGILRGERFQNAEVGLPVVRGEDVADVVRAVDQVDFKVSETVLRVDHGWSERNRYAARDGAAPVLFVIGNDKLET